MMNTTADPRRLAVALGFLVFAGCQTSPIAPVESALHASNADPNTTIAVVSGSAGDKMYLLATNQRGYRLDCPTSQTLITMLRGAGFDPRAVAFQPPLSLTEPAIE